MRIDTAHLKNAWIDVYPDNRRGGAICRVRFTVNGKKHTKTQKFPSTEKALEAAEKLDKRKKRLDQAPETTPNDPPRHTIALSPHMPLSEFMDAIREKMRSELETKTWSPYGAGLKLRVTPALGHRPLSTITPLMCFDFMQNLQEKAHSADHPISVSTVKNTGAALRLVFEHAQRNGLIAANPMSGMPRRRVVREKAAVAPISPREKSLKTVAELHALAQALHAESGEQIFADFALFSCYTTLRVAEVAGALVGDVKNVNGRPARLIVVRQATLTDAGIEFKAPKSKRARVVPLCDEAAEIVERRIKAARGDVNARLFPGPRGGVITVKTLKNTARWEQATIRAGLPGTTRHDLRHTGATWMVDAGVPIEVVQDILGHQDIATTRKYIHTLDAALDRAMSAYGTHIRST